VFRETAVIKVTKVRKACQGCPVYLFKLVVMEFLDQPVREARR